MSNSERQRERPDTPPALRAPRWFGDRVGQLALLSPFLVTAGIVWLSWALYGTSDFHTVPSDQLRRLIASAGITGSDATAAAVWEYTAHLAWNTLAGLYFVFLVAAVLLGAWIASRVFAAVPRCGPAGGGQWIALLVALSTGDGRTIGRATARIGQYMFCEVAGFGSGPDFDWSGDTLRRSVSSL